MEEKIKTILRHQYPDKYEDLHEQTAELICALLGAVGQVKQLVCDACVCDRHLTQIKCSECGDTIKTL